MFFFSVLALSCQCWNQCAISIHLDEMLNKLRMKINSLFYLYVKDNAVFMIQSNGTFHSNFVTRVPLVTANGEVVLCYALSRNCISSFGSQSSTFRNTHRHRQPPTPAPHSIVPGTLIMSTWQGWGWGGVMLLSGPGDKHRGTWC